MPVTLAQIAQASGVGKATVSRALRNGGPVSEASRRKVLRAAARLGYRPDPVMSAFAQRRWGGRSEDGTPLAFLFCSRQDVFSSECLLAAQRRASELGYHLKCHRLTEFQTHKHASRVLEHTGVQGLIVSHQLPNDSQLDLDWEKFAVVSCGLRQDRIPASIVMPNVFNGMRLCLEAALRAGYRKPGIIFLHEGPDDNTAYQMGAYWAACLKGWDGFSQAPDLGIPPLFHVQDIRRWFRHYKPDVILGSNHELYNELSLAGWKFPKQAAFICFGWNDKTGRIAGVDLHTELIGASAVDLLDVQIRSGKFGVSTNKITHMIEPSLLSGASMPF